MSRKQAADKLMESIILSALEKEDERLAASVPPDKELAENHVFSSEFEHKMGAMVRTEQRKAKAALLRRRSLRAAIALAAVVSVILALAVCAGAFKIDFFGLITKFTGKYISIESKVGESSNSGLGSAIDMSKIPSDWVDYWLPAYVPDGYSVSAVNGFGNQKKVDYSDVEGNILSFCQWGLDKNTVFSDTEDSSSRKIKILDEAGYLLEKDTPVGKRVIVNWGNSSTTFKLEGVIAENEILKMAESIINIEMN